MKKRQIVIWAVFLGSALCAVAPARAQDDPRQTVENAELFLDKALVGAFGQMYVSNVEAAGWHYTVAEASPSERCVSRFKVNVPAFNYYGTNYAARASDDVIVDWRKVTQVSRDENGTWITIYGLGWSHPTKFWPSSPTMAARVAFAMEFLRTECDETKGLGF